MQDSVSWDIFGEAGLPPKNFSSIEMGKHVSRNRLRMCNCNNRD